MKIPSPKQNTEVAIRCFSSTETGELVNVDNEMNGANRRSTLYENQLGAAKDLKRSRRLTLEFRANGIDLLKLTKSIYPFYFHFKMMLYFLLVFFHIKSIKVCISSVTKSETILQMR